MTRLRDHWLAILYLLGMAAVIVFAIAWAYGVEAQCKARSCPEGQIARLVSGNCICVTVPK